jgi:5-methylcytosine-specific restriction endonuclease McrA
MAFSEDVIKLAWKRAEERCECRRQRHDHAYVRCNKKLVWSNRGRDGIGCWEAHHRLSVAAGGDDSLSNCEILCWDCHSKTL